MKLMSTVTLGLGCCLILFLPLALRADHDYRVSFDTLVKYNENVLEQPYIEIQNPKDSGGSITVDDIIVQWNDLTDISTPENGITKHDGEDNCTVEEDLTLAAGEGLTINVLEAIQKCTTEFPDCTGTACTTDAQCGSDCMCLAMKTPAGWTGRCTPKFGSANVIATSRVTVVIKVTESLSIDPLVHAVQYVLDMSHTNPEDRIKGSYEVPVKEY